MYGPCTVAQLNLGRCKILSVLVRILKILIVPLLTLGVMATHVRAQSQSCPLRSSNAISSRCDSRLASLACQPESCATVSSCGTAAFGYQDVEGLVRHGRHAVPSAGSYAGAFVDGVTATVPRAQISRPVGPCAPLEFAVLEDNTTVAQTLAHAGAAGAFEYSTARYAALTTVIDQCSSARYSRLITEEILNRLGMSSVPSHDLADGTPIRREFTNNERDRYVTILRRVATPYKVTAGRATRSDYARPSLSAATGIVSTVHDLARFDGALDDDILVEADTRRRAWEAAGTVPTGLGWFVQQCNNERIVWHFGCARCVFRPASLRCPAAS